MRITVTVSGSATAEYNYDDEPQWDAPVDPVVYVTDQEEFLCDEDKQPEWLRQQLAEGAAYRRRGTTRRRWKSGRRTCATRLPV